MSRPFLFAGIFLVTAGCLASGAGWLSAPLLRAFPIPAGNLVAAVLFISITAVTVTVSRSGARAHGASYLLLAAAVLWLPLSMLLAGNLNLNFTTAGWRSKVWMFYTLKALPGGVVMLLLWQMISRAISRWKRAAAPQSASDDCEK